MSQEGSLSFQKPIEVPLDAPPETIKSLLKAVAEESTIQDGGRFRLEEVQHRLGPALSVRADMTGRSGSIGIILLLPLGNDRTMLRVPQGRGAKDQARAFELDPSGNLFSQYLLTALQELARLNFLKVQKGKGPLGYHLPHQQKHSHSNN